MREVAERKTLSRRTIRARGRPTETQHRCSVGWWQGREL